MSDQDHMRGATHLECTGTGETVESEQLIGLSAAGKPLFARYDLDAIKNGFQMSDVACRRADLWRYAEVLPVRDPAARVALGEGWTPLLESKRTRSSSGRRRCNTTQAEARVACPHRSTSQPGVNQRTW